MGTFTGQLLFPVCPSARKYMIENDQARQNFHTGNPISNAPSHPLSGANPNSPASADETGVPTPAAQALLLSDIPHHGTGLCASTQAALLGNNPNPLVEVLLQSYFAYESPR